MTAFFSVRGIASLVLSSELDTSFFNINAVRHPLLLGVGGRVKGLIKRVISGEAGRPVGRSGRLHARSAVP